MKLHNYVFTLLSRALQTLEETEAKEKEKIYLQQQSEEKLVFLINAYMEYLDGDYLFQQMFANDKGKKDYFHL